MNPQKQSRKRGVILTPQGLKKLQEAKFEAESEENYNKPYTLEVLSDRTSLDPSTLIKVFAGEVGVDKRTLSRCFRAFNLHLEQSDYFLPSETLSLTPFPHPKIESSLSKSDYFTSYSSRNESLGKLITLRQATPQEPTKYLQHSAPNISWGEAPDVSVFYGRTEELIMLNHWIMKEHCRLVMLLGIGGMGKTYLSVKLAQQIQSKFDFVIWRSLRNAPSIPELLAGLIQFLSNQQETDLPESVDRRILRLIEYLQSHRCLLIFDSGESILRRSESSGDKLSQHPRVYREGYEDYGQLFRCLGEMPHQSCLLLTSREKPKWLGFKEGKNLPIRSFKLSELQLKDVQEILTAKGCCCQSLALCKKLKDFYAGNPLNLKVASKTICNVFNGCLDEFFRQKVTVFGEIKVILDQQINCLSTSERMIMFEIATHQIPVRFSELREKIVDQISSSEILEALESLEERSLIEKKQALFSLQPVVQEYIIEQLIGSNSQPKQLELSRNLFQEPMITCEWKDSCSNCNPQHFTHNH
ncbi:NACHT domain-containing protein [Phormidium sp. LEGE 05292]|uniref:NB-ARC domain-containing protein n=1 Tax=[Phormidium] sp. LEGE 05292 TaxID=767427 RepID=UPI0018806260|nr:NB-ARC domain-containing protein [Phormidium sp. LEGE 05292]MBE9228826.1 NACHT domain-containing protein [Phormidium sp. LEGE 05292]